MDRDVFRCQKMKNVESGVVLHMDSWDLPDTRFVVENELQPLFSDLDHLLVLSRLMIVSFRC
jgi:hypothetical protein